MKCDYTCDRPAVAVWHRTDADRKATKAPRAGKMVALLPRFQVCEVHKTPWRPWVSLDAPPPPPVETPSRKRRQKVCPHCGGKV